MMPTGCSKSLSLGAWMVASLLLEDFTLQLRCGRTRNPMESLGSLNYPGVDGVDGVEYGGVSGSDLEWIGTSHNSSPRRNWGRVRFILNFAMVWSLRCDHWCHPMLGILGRTSQGLTGLVGFGFELPRSGIPSLCRSCGDISNFNGQ